MYKLGCTQASSFISQAVFQIENVIENGKLRPSISATRVRNRNLFELLLPPMYLVLSILFTRHQPSSERSWRFHRLTRRLVEMSRFTSSRCSDGMESSRWVKARYAQKIKGIDDAVCI